MNSASLISVYGYGLVFRVISVSSGLLNSRTLITELPNPLLTIMRLELFSKVRHRIPERKHAQETKARL